VNRTVPGAVDIVGTAKSDATITVNNQAVARKGDYFYNELTVDNSSGPVYQSVDVVGVKNNVGPNGEDAVTENTGFVFLPQSPELPVHDADGNLTSDGRWNYSWDAENRLISIESIAGLPGEAKRRLEYTYDNKWRMIQRKQYAWNESSYDLSATQKFVYDSGSMRMIAMLDGSGNLLQSYQWGKDLSGSLDGAGGVGGLLMVHDVATNSDHFPFYNGNGNVMGFVNAATGIISLELDYDPFGKLIRESGPMAKLIPFGFSTKYRDPVTGYLWYGYRWYDPKTGRWLSRDPIGERGAESLYGFVENDAINFVDTLGLFSSRYHRVITINALEHTILGPNYVKIIADANVGQDDGAATNSGPFADSLNHGDNNRLTETIDRIKQRLDEIAKSDCKNCKEIKEQLKAFGRTIHGVQDIYAHSTYVETSGANTRQASDVPLWPLFNATGGANVPPGVSSGAYKWPNDGAPSPSHKDINKDEPSSKRGKEKNNTGVTYFDLAESAATRHTTSLWNQLYRSLSPKTRKVLIECAKEDK